MPPYASFQQKTPYNKRDVQKRCVWNEGFLLDQPCLFTLQFIMLLHLQYTVYISSIQHLQYTSQ